MSTVSFVVRIGGVLTNVTSAVLSDPTGAYGVQRNDLPAMVVADGTALVNTAVGVYQYTFVDPADDLEYTAWLEFVYSGVTYHIEKVFDGPTSAVATDLTTVPNVKTYMGITAATWDALLLELVSASTDLIQSYCNRRFASQNYTGEIYDGPDSSRLLLRQFPVTAVGRVTYGRLDVVGVRNTTVNATRANASVTSTGVVLTVTAIPVIAPDTVDWATYTTLTAVVAQINALGNGWEATLQSSATGSYVSTDLLPAGGRACLNGFAHLDMPEPQALEDYIVHWDEGMLELYGSWGESSQNIFVDYTAGYVTIPDDIEIAAKDLVRIMFNRRTVDGSLKSEKLGDYSYTLADMADGGDMPDYVMATLRRYRNRRVGV